MQSMKMDDFPGYMYSVNYLDHREKIGTLPWHKL